ncbi:MAG: NIPSNAP family protein [Verrucomicrobiae bacterium]|nr:NIPSNAP family protein [Verrucomicrobiae bacterium]
MRTTTLILGLALMTIVTLFGAEDTKCYEMRVYYAAQDKLDALHARFRNHTCKLFEKHGMVNIGYWTPLENPDHKLIYILAYPNREAREKSWKAFMSDPEWQTAFKESEKQGRLVEKVESYFLTPTDFSPEIKPSAEKENRLFELRTYTAAPEKLEALKARFRDHTVKLFEKHGIKNFGYWTLTPGQKGSENTLIYILIHKDKNSAEKSFTAFRNDPAWIAARKESEEKAGGPLTVNGGVKSEFLTPTDYSPSK